MTSMQTTEKSLIVLSVDVDKTYMNKNFYLDRNQYVSELIGIDRSTPGIEHYSL